MIRFACTCGTELCLPLVLAGESGRCPGCRRTLEAPVPDGHVPWHEVQRGEDAVEGVRIIQVARNPMANRTRALLAFPCPSCAEPLRIKISHAGSRGKCGHCAATFKIPERPAPELGRAEKSGWGSKARAEAPPSKKPDPSPESAARAPRVAPPTQPSRRSPPPPTRTLPRRGRRAPPPPVGREAFRVVRVACGCGRKVKAPLVRIRAGEARCPSCDEVLSE